MVAVCCLGNMLSLEPSFFDLTDKIFVAEIDLNRSALYAKLFLEVLSQLLKQFEPSGD